MNTPLVSIIMPVFNAEVFLREAIESILAQTYQQWELICVDDGSQDRSVEIVESMARKDRRIRLIRQQHNAGVAEALNRGLKEARGEYMARMDADDVSYPKRLETQVNYLLDHPQVVSLGTFMQEINEEGKVRGKRRLPTEHKDIIEMMYYAMGQQHPTLLFNRKLIPGDFEWYRSVKYAEDLDMLFRLIKYGTFANIPQYLYGYRIHQANETMGQIKKTFWAAAKVRRRAVAEYDYVPSLKARGLFWGSQMVMALGGETLMLKLYRKMRREKR
jgi:glycosyltransferase involved in cell wall biosynthesis